MFLSAPHKCSVSLPAYYRSTVIFSFHVSQFVRSFVFLSVIEGRFSIYFFFSTRATFPALFSLLDLITREIFAVEKRHGALRYEICCSVQIRRVCTLQMYSSAPLCITLSAYTLPLKSCPKYLNLYISRLERTFLLFKLHGDTKLYDSIFQNSIIKDS